MQASNSSSVSVNSKAVYHRANDAMYSSINARVASVSCEEGLNEFEAAIASSTLTKVGSLGRERAATTITALSSQEVGKAAAAQAGVASHLCLGAPCVATPLLSAINVASVAAEDGEGASRSGMTSVIRFSGLLTSCSQGAPRREV